MRKKLLIIGASILQLPAIKRAKELGYYVAVADYNPNAIGIKYADEYYNASTIDVDAITDVALKFKPDGIMTLATDMPMRSIAVATKALGIPGISLETAIKATDKGEMIKAFKEYDVPSPWFYVISDFEQIKKLNITYPCIIKPTDNAGSRGVCLVENQEQLAKAFAYSVDASRSGSVIIEEYLTGQEVSVEAFIVDGKINILTITDKLTTGSPHFVEMGHSQPSQLSKAQVSEVESVAAKAIQAVGINSGPAHVEIMVTNSGPKMIELGARMGGDCITTHLVPLSTGIDMIQATIETSVGLIPDVTTKWKKGSAIRFLRSNTGVIKEIIGEDEAIDVLGVKEVSFTKREGDTVTDIHSSVDRIGYVIAQAETAHEAVQICDNVLNNVLFVKVE